MKPDIKKKLYKMIKWMPALLLSLMLLPQKTYPQQNWKLKKDSEGIKVYTAPAEGNPVDAYKAEITFNASAEKVMALLLDFDNGCKFTYKCDASKTIEPFRDGRALYYIRIAPPWPASNRDMVCEFEATNEKNGRIIILVKPSKIDYEGPKNTVRMTNFMDKRIIQPLPSGKCKYTVEGIFDPGGSMPAWITNMFLTDGPYFSLKEMRTALEEE